MILHAVRSGLVEAIHPVSGVAVDEGGRVLAGLGGDRDRRFFVRSAAKPLQAAVSQEMGADLSLEQLAVASSSHRGLPVHVAHVRRMLDEAGIEETLLRCPPERPLSPSADRLWAARGSRDAEPLFHNCSGKHSAMLRACAAKGWSMEYDTPQHPLQRRVVELFEQSAGAPAEPLGVDGCGLPTMRADVTGLARTFSRLALDPEMGAVAQACLRFAPLTADGDSPEALLNRWFPAVVKGGAMGCIGAVWMEGGVGFGVKCWTGDGTVAAAALVVLVERLGLLGEHQRRQLSEVARPPILGGGREVGGVEAAEEG